MYADRRYPMRKSNFVAEWMDTEPSLPVPKIDWIEKKILDIPYGGGELQKLDLYYPNGEKEGNYPLIIIVHGGGFSHMDKRDWHLYTGFFGLERGFAVASVNYRLAPKNPFPAAALDTENAVAFLKGKAEEFKLDKDNFFLIGTSAGGNLVSLCGLKAENDDKKDFKVNSVAALCPVVDLDYTKKNIAPYMRLVFLILLPIYLSKNKKSLEMLDEFLGVKSVKRSFADIAKAASARTYFKGKSPSFYFLHGGKDSLVPPSQSTEFYDFLKEEGLKEEDLVLKIMDDALHAGAGVHYFERENIIPIIEFFERHLK